MIKVQAFGQYERYQQMFGAARVAGGQLSLERGRGGESEVVLGSHDDAIVPSNAVVLSEADAIAIAQAALPEATSRTAVLVIEPSDGRYYYAVDSRGDALRHAHWIDAQTGAVFNHFDSLTGGCTSSPGGVGFLGEQLDLIGKVTSGTGYSLATARQVTRDLGSQKKPFFGTANQDADGCFDAVGRTSPGQGAPSRRTST